MSESFEQHERLIDPHRVEEQKNAHLEAANRLRDRGISISPSDSDDDVANVLEAIERFESIVESLGGDLMVNRIGVAEPQDPAFVLPTREANEAAARYAERVLTASNELRLIETDD